MYILKKIGTDFKEHLVTLPKKITVKFLKRLIGSCRVLDYLSNRLEGEC